MSPVICTLFTYRGGQQMWYLESQIEALPSGLAGFYVLHNLGIEDVLSLESKGYGVDESCCLRHIQDGR